MVKTDDVWDQDRVTVASDRQIPGIEYERWASANDLEAVFFDQNYQFDEIRALRDSGVLTVGRFVWEAFREEHVAATKAAFDIIYSLTACEQDRYREFGIDSPRIHWGCHPDLITTMAEKASNGLVRFFYPGGQLSMRKPTGAVIEAFERVKAPHARLVIKSQRPLVHSDVVLPERQEDLAAARSALADEEYVATDDRIELVVEDLATDDHLALFRSCDVCLAPSRWEGLGLHLYEAISFGMPLIVNDNPPANEVVSHQENGLLVESSQIGTAPSGIPSWEPNVDCLAKAIEAMLDDGLRRSLAEGAARTRDHLPWERTVEEIGQLLR